MVSKRIADMILGLHKGEKSLDDIKQWLMKVKPEGKYQIQDTVLYMKREGLITAINANGDPVNNFVALAGFLIDPIFWFFVCKDGLERVSEEWSNMIKEKRHT